MRCGAGAGSRPMGRVPRPSPSGGRRPKERHRTRDAARPRHPLRPLCPLHRLSFLPSSFSLQLVNKFVLDSCDLRSYLYYLESKSHVKRQNFASPSDYRLGSLVGTLAVLLNRTFAFSCYSMYDFFWNKIILTGCKWSSKIGSTGYK